jgi:hypothetical protein
VQHINPIDETVAPYRGQHAIARLADSDVLLLPRESVPAVDRANNIIVRDELHHSACLRCSRILRYSRILRAAEFLDSPFNPPILAARLIGALRYPSYKDNPRDHPPKDSPPASHTIPERHHSSPSLAWSAKESTLRVQTRIILRLESPVWSAIRSAMALKPSRNRIEVQRVISVGQDRDTGEAIIRVKSPLGRVVTLRVHPSQLRKLANGVMGLVEARAASPR